VGRYPSPLKNPRALKSSNAGERAFLRRSSCGALGDNRKIDSTSGMRLTHGSLLNYGFSGIEGEEQLKTPKCGIMITS
jgi:hypothetical protein